MKLPASVGMKKSKAIENMVGELGLETQPPCTEEICTEFNEIRSVRVVLMPHVSSADANEPVPQVGHGAPLRAKERADGLRV